MSTRGWTDEELHAAIEAMVKYLINPVKGFKIGKYESGYRNITRFGKYYIIVTGKTHDFEPIYA